MAKKETKKKTEKVEAEIIEVGNDTKVIPLTDVLVVPAVTPAQAKEAWKMYQDLKKAVLTPDDYLEISTFQQGKGSVKKRSILKSGWRKLATFFNLSVDIVKEERREYDMPTPYFVWECTVKASAANGRFMIGTGSCASNERKFAHAEHDVRAMAETRAKNRAISDLIGGGEVSAEEVEQQKAEKEQTCPTDHAALPEKKVATKDSKNFGRPYAKCPNCTYWKWLDVAEAN